MSNRAVAVVGMCGSGKSVLTQLFVQRGWSDVYFGGVAVSQLNKNGIEVNEANERAMREGLRAKYGMGAFAYILQDEILQKLSQGNVVLDGLYSWSEYTQLQEALSGQLIVLAVVTNSAVRYHRLSDRPIRPLTASQARGRDYAEITNSEKGGPIAIADYYLDNNGDMDSMLAQFEQFMQWLDNQ